MKVNQYREDPERSLGGFLPDNIYSNAINAFVIDCVDFVAINREHETFWLAKRIIESARGIWRFGGRRIAGESMPGAAVRLAKRELKLTLSPDRFEYVIDQDCIWSYRAQEPQDGGCHTLIHVFSCEMAPDELVHANQSLDPKEYDTSFGLQQFDRQRLVGEGVRPPLLDLYDAIFN